MCLSVELMTLLSVVEYIPNPTCFLVPKWPVYRFGDPPMTLQVRCWYLKPAVLSQEVAHLS